MKTQFYWQILTIICSLILNSCGNNKNETISQKAPLTNKEREYLLDSCLTQMNSELIQLLSNPTELKTYLKLNDSDIEIILAKSSKEFSKSKKEILLEKIANSISDNTVIPITCNIQDKITVRTGDLALLCLYSIENYPFAAALGAQWCTGNSISNKISLPDHLIAFGTKESMQKYYKSYLKSDTRKEWQSERSR